MIHNQSMHDFHQQMEMRTVISQCFTSDLFPATLFFFFVYSISFSRDIERILFWGLCYIVTRFVIVQYPYVTCKDPVRLYFVSVNPQASHTAFIHTFTGTCINGKTLLFPSMDFFLSVPFHSKTLWLSHFLCQKECSHSLPAVHNLDVSRIPIWDLCAQ